MQALACNTFRMVMAEAKSGFVQFIWRPVLWGISLVGERRKKLAGKRPDFNRKSFWEDIQKAITRDMGIGPASSARGRRTPSSISTARSDQKTDSRGWCQVKVVGQVTLESQNPDNYLPRPSRPLSTLAIFVAWHWISERFRCLGAPVFLYPIPKLLRLAAPNFQRACRSTAPCVPFHKQPAVMPACITIPTRARLPYERTR